MYNIFRLLTDKVASQELYIVARPSLEKKKLQPHAPGGGMKFTVSEIERRGHLVVCHRTYKADR